LVLAVNLILSVIWAGSVHDIFETVDSRQNDVVHYRELLDLFNQLPTEPKLLKELQLRMGDDASRPQSALSGLARIMQFAQMRHSGMFGVFHLILQLMFLIDFHLLGALENWHREYGSEVRDWFDAVGELEAIASLASLVHDHPDWSFADYSNENQRFESEDLGHPLIANPVKNSVSLGPSGTFLLVTGSNMSGKSTLLRTIGLNTVLAQAGAPINATKLALPPIEIATSMRIQDSLEDGVSFFMAELQRLKQIVDQADGLRNGSQRTMLFLLDEILQGTNSAERHIAVTRVVQQLTNAGAMGAISTHDLELAKNDELLAISNAVHFRESISDEEGMTFDYMMRQGVATTTNALKLLELVGISQGN
jgi:DNA mismatch repair ATPase MutS